MFQYTHTVLKYRVNVGKFPTDKALKLGDILETPLDPLAVEPELMSASVASRHLAPVG
jgi:hypothetical protein